MKKLIKYLLLLIVIFPFNVFASVKTFDRNDMENYGVNKRWEINNTNIDNVLKTPSVSATEKIYDFSDILTEEEEQEIYKLFGEYTELTNFDIVFVSDSLPYTYDKVNEEYAVDFYDYNDFGINFEKYSGILLFRNTYVNDPYYNIYMFGDSQLYYVGDRVENVLDSIYNDFHSGNYVAGLNTFVNEMTKYYNEGIADEMSNYHVDKNGFLYQEYVPPYLSVFVISLLISILIVGILIKKNKMVRKATEAKEYLDKNSIKYTDKKDQFIRSHTSSYTVSDSGPSGGGGGFSSSIGSSGGGFSSGGGRHG